MAIIHLATHADFNRETPVTPTFSYGDTQLKMNQLRQMRWNQPPQVELLVLSACRTAVGDVDAELGFGGLAVQAGVKSALASLWSVSDGGTLALMSEFYRQLSQPDVTIKAEALRRAQIAMLRGQLRLEEGQLARTWVSRLNPCAA
jgi:CHAT domain-containing protein